MPAARNDAGSPTTPAAPHPTPPTMSPAAPPPTAWTMPSDREVVATRTFAAPRALVFDAWTTPEHVRRWYGLRFLTMTTCEIDRRPGGRYRYVLRAPDGSEYAFSGVYREVVRPERLVHTWEFEAMPGTASVGTVTFAENAGRTTVTMHTRFQTPEHYAGWAATGGREGMAETLDRLDELLPELLAAHGR